jgi:hypothetical protein
MQTFLVILLTMLLLILWLFLVLNVAQVQMILVGRYLLLNGQQLFVVLNWVNRFGQLRRIIMSHTRRYGALFALLIDVKRHILGVILEFGDLGIVELFLLNLKWLLKQGHQLVIFA